MSQLLKGGAFLQLLLVDHREEKWLIFHALLLDADTAVVFASSESIRDFWRLLFAEFLVNEASLTDLVDAHILVKARQFFLALALPERVVPSEERGRLHVVVREVLQCAILRMAFHSLLFYAVDRDGAERRH